MYSKAKIGGHSIHPMLVSFPIVFYTLSLIAFIVYQFVSADVFWFRLGYFCTFAGVLSAIAAAIPGTIDWAYGIPKESAAKKRGLTHMILNVAALILFIVNAVRLRGTWNTPFADVTGIWVVALIGVALTAAAGYHGWALVAVHKVGVSMTPEQERIEPTDKMDRIDHEISHMPTRPRTV